MKKKLLTAVVYRNEFSRHYLMAQEKSSAARLMRRLVADDPIWSRGNVRLIRLPMLPKSKFRRGLAIQAIHMADFINKYNS